MPVFQPTFSIKLFAAFCMVTLTEPMVLSESKALPSLAWCIIASPGDSGDQVGDQVGDAEKETGLEILGGNYVVVREWGRRSAVRLGGACAGGSRRKEGDEFIDD